MGLELQISRTERLLYEDDCLSLHDDNKLMDIDRLILENQLVIMEELKKVNEKPDRAFFGPG